MISRDVAGAIFCVWTTACGLGAVGGDYPDVTAAADSDAASADVVGTDAIADSADAASDVDMPSGTDAMASDSDAAPDDADGTDKNCPEGCDDGDACTTDKCDVSLGCQHTATTCDDSNACTLDTCASATGCVHEPLDVTSCSDNDLCTDDACVPAVGCVHEPLSATACDDANACTVDGCTPVLGCAHLALDASPCDDGDPCTGADTCVGTACSGQITRWLQTSALPSGVGQWVGIVPRKDGSRLLIGWQRISAWPAKFQMVTQRIAVSGQALATAQTETSLDNLVIDLVTTNGPDVLVQGHTTDNLTMGQPWFGLIGEQDQLLKSGLYEPQNPIYSSGTARAAFGKTITPDGGGAPFTRWYASVDGVNTGSKTTHQFYTIDPDGKPMYHSLGAGNETCVALLIRDGVMVGTCNTTKATDYFRATFTPTGKVTKVVRVSPPTDLAFTPVTATLRPDGHARYFGYAPVSPGVPLIVGTDANGELDLITGLAKGPDLYVFGAIQPADGSSWLFGTTGGQAAAWRLDSDTKIVASHTYGPGTWLNGRLDEDGLWLVGASTALTTPWPSDSPAGLVARADFWGYETCAASGGCAAKTNCADGNSCTNDWCTDGACSHAPATLCDDGDACTVTDTCAILTSTCQPGVAGSCDDSNPCTLDACGAGGCSHAPVADYTNCDDGNSCTSMDHCDAGVCIHGNPQLPGLGCENSGVCLADGQCVLPWAVDVVAGGTHTCAVSPNGRVRCWGDNTDHELGTANVPSSWIPLDVPVSTSPTPTTIVLGAGDGFNVAWVDIANYPKGWGRSDVLQANVDLTGQGTTTTTPQDASTGLGQFVHVSLGANHGCAIEKLGAVKCWGKSEFGQAVGVNALGMNATAVNGLGSVKAVAAGGNNSCVIQDDGTVRCWGEMAGAWQTGTAGTSASTTPVTVQNLPAASGIALGKQHGCAITANQKVRCWGANNAGQLGNGKPGQPAFSGAGTDLAGLVSQIAAGDAFTCLLTSQGAVACWGDGSTGQMGNGANVSNSAPLVVQGLEHIVQVTAHGSHACARRFDGAVFCWGTGGIPGTSASTIPIAVPDSLP